MRKSYSPEFKAKLVLEVFRGERMLNEIASDNYVYPNMITRWKTEAFNNFYLLFQNENAKIPKQSKDNEVAQKQKGCRDLYPVFMPLKNVDMPSFKTVGEEYACDEKRVYFYTNRNIQSPSAHQLQIFYENIKKSSGIVYPVETGYALDRHFVYYKGKILSEHPLSFQQFGLSGYFTDGMDVFYTGKELSADIDTFEIIDTQNAEDQNYVFSGAMVYKEK